MSIRIASRATPSATRIPSDLCPSNPDVRAYARALVADVARYDVATIMAESLHFHVLEHGYHHERYFIELGRPGRYLLGLCFCDHCLARAPDGGRRAATRAATPSARELEHVFDRQEAVTAGRARRGAPRRTSAGGELAAYLRVRGDTVTTLAAEAAEVGGGRRQAVRLHGPERAPSRAMRRGARPAAPAAEISWRLGVDLGALGRVGHGFAGRSAYAADVEPRPARSRGVRPRRSAASRSRVCLRPVAARLRGRRQPGREADARAQARRRGRRTSTTTASSGSRRST